MKHTEFYTAAYIAIFGALWGMVEILLGNFLHLFDVPFKGTILSALGCIICLVGSNLLPTKDKLPIISIGIVAIVLRLFSFGVFEPHIFASMFIAALFMQIAVNIIGYNLLGFITAGVLACFSPYVSALFFWGLVYQHGIAEVYRGIIKEHDTFSFLVHSGIIIIFFILLLNVLAGILSGVSAFYLGKKLKYVPNTQN